MDEIETMRLEARHLASFSTRLWFCALVLSCLVHGSSLMAQTIGICASRTLQVYAIDTADGWAKTKCAPAPTEHPERCEWLRLELACEVDRGADIGEADDPVPRA
jgi:hypothetical protein